VRGSSGAQQVYTRGNSSGGSKAQYMARQAAGSERYARGGSRDGSSRLGAKAEVRGSKDRRRGGSAAAVAEGAALCKSSRQARRVQRRGRPGAQRGSYMGSIQAAVWQRVRWYAIRQRYMRVAARKSAAQRSAAMRGDGGSGMRRYSAACIHKHSDKYATMLLTATPDSTAALPMKSARCERRLSDSR